MSPKAATDAPQPATREMRNGGRSGLACEYGRCESPATLSLRFGDGTFPILAGQRQRQVAVSYCELHGGLVERLFVVCDLERLQVKRCTRCDRWLPATTEAFRPNLKLRSSLSSWCRDCQNQATRRWRTAHPELNERRREGPFPKTCVDCGADFLAVRRTVQTRCPDCQAKRRLSLSWRLRQPSRDPAWRPLPAELVELAGEAEISTAELEAVFARLGAEQTAAVLEGMIERLRAIRAGTQPPVSPRSARVAAS